VEVRITGQLRGRGLQPRARLRPAPREDVFLGMPEDFFGVAGDPA